MRRSLRYSLASLLILAAIVAAYLAGYRHGRSAAQQEREHTYTIPLFK